MAPFTPRAEAPVIRVADVAYVRFARRDLARAERYFVDFGLKVSARTDKAIYLRGVLPQHHCVIIERAEHDAFGALGLRAASARDLRPRPRTPPRCMRAASPAAARSCAWSIRRV